MAHPASARAGPWLHPVLSAELGDAVGYSTPGRPTHPPAERRAGDASTDVDDRPSGWRATGLASAHEPA
jgi:hypothetical protein